MREQQNGEGGREERMKEERGNEITLGRRRNGQVRGKRGTDKKVKRRRNERVKRYWKDVREERMEA